MQEALSYNDIDLREFALMLWRRKRVFIILGLLGFSLSFVIAQTLTPRYTAKTLLLLEQDQNSSQVDEMQSALLSSMKFNSALVLSELEVLKSRTLARQVVERLALMTDAEFNERINEVGVDTKIFKQFSLYKSELNALPPEVVNRGIAEVVKNFQDRLKVRTIPGSYAIQIVFESENAAKAALIANTIADVYIEQRLEAKFASTKKLTGWLNKRLTELQTQVREAESDVERYRASRNLVVGERTVVSAEQLSELNSQLVTAKASQAEAEARLEQVTKLSRNREDLDKLSELVNSDLLKELKLEQARIEAYISKLSSRYGEKHPEMIKARLELTEIKKSIAAEILNIRETLKGEVGFAEAKVRAFEDGLQEITGQRNIDNEAMIRLRELEREAQSSRLIYDTFLETYKRSDNQEELQEPEAKIISYAVIPDVPSFPNKKLIVVLGVLLSSFLAFILAILFERFDNSYKSAYQLERAFGFSCFGLVPAVANLGQPDLAAYTLSKPTSITAESVRTLRMLLNLQTEARPKVIGMTSSLPGEGKTTLAVWLARQAAKSGEKVIVIDADMRKPNLHQALDLPNDSTLTDYLNGNAELGDIVQKDTLTKAHMIFAGASPDNALDLVSGKRMSDLVTSLRQVYDLILIDTPACLAVSDSSVIATMSDQMLYAVAWDKTPCEIVAGGIKRFKDIDFKNVSFVLTHVDIHKHAKYGYGDTPYYYGPDESEA